MRFCTARNARRRQRSSGERRLPRPYPFMPRNVTGFSDIQTSSIQEYMNRFVSFVGGLALAALASSVQQSCGKSASKAASDAKGIVINGHRFVDLQLPSGLLWAETNVGADKPTDCGGYYAWGETKEKADYSETTYLYGHSYGDMTKYNTADGKRILETADDAATACWGDSCRMPTYNEFLELKDTANCLWTWAEKAAAPGDTVRGYEVKSLRNGNSIFLPAAGAHNGTHLYLNGTDGIYWTSSLSDENIGDAFTLSFYFANSNWYRNARHMGSPVRAVAGKDDGKGR